MNFAQWMAQAQKVESIGHHPSILDEDMEFTPGYVFPGGYWVEELDPELVMPEVFARGRYWTIIGSAKIQSDDLTRVAEPLFKFSQGGDI